MNFDHVRDIRLDFAFKMRIENEILMLRWIYNVKEGKEQYIIAKLPKSTKFIYPGERELDLPIPERLKVTKIF